MSECLKFAENQMANTFFGFNTALNDHSERLGSSPEDIEGLEAEEEYDALNDETFGALENEGDLDDWEAQHEHLAEIAESSRHSNDIESFLDQLGLNDEEPVVPKDSNVWAYNIEHKNGEKLNHSVLDSSVQILAGMGPDNLSGASQHYRPPMPHTQGPKLRTVEELERMLLTQSKPRFPPGFQPLLLNASGGGGGWPTGAPPQGGPMPPGLMRVMGPRIPPGGQATHPPPGFVGYQQGYPLPPHFSFPPPPRLPTLPPGLLPPRGVHPHSKHPFPPHHRPHNQSAHPHGHPPHPHNQSPHQHPHHQLHHPLHMPPGHMTSQQQQQQHSGGDRGGDRGAGHHGGHHIMGGGDVRDEYAGLMNNREKQWLLNIQLLQVNTGTPYFDDYYYTVFKERQAKNKEAGGDQRLNQRGYHNRGNVRDGNVGHHHRGGQNHNHQNQVQEQQNPVKKTYTPLQFENSLGKLQFGSVTAPRKIIDMDIIAATDGEPQQTSRDSRKTKQLLLELEALYSLLLRAEDLRSPVARANQEKLLELRQKQRLREMDAAPTAEQKQQVLKLLQAESLTPLDTPLELLTRLLSALLEGAGDRLAAVLAVRKGKMLVLRALPQWALHGDVLHAPLADLWARLLAALPIVGRRDATGDGVFVRLCPHFKKFINVTDMDQILDLVSNLTEIMKLENSRSTPLSHQSKAPLHFILQNKFGISAISLILQRADSLLASCSDKQLADWSAFLAAMIDTLSLVGSMTSSPLEPISDSCLARHLEKLDGVSLDKKQLLEKVFVDLNQ